MGRDNRLLSRCPRAFLSSVIGLCHNRRNQMKRFLAFACLIATLGGCAVVPIGYPVYDHGYRHNRSYGYDGDRWHHSDDYRWRYGGYRY